MNYIDKLKALDLNEKEATLYLKGLEMGEFTISSIAQATNIKRPTCYLVIEELLKKGLITLIPRGRKNLYRIAPPEVLLETIHKKASLAQTILPFLQNIQVKKNSTPTIHFYRGHRGIETIYNDVLKSKPGTTLYSITPVNQLLNVVGSDFFYDWVKKRAARKIQSKTILPVKDKSTKGFFDPEALREVRFLPEPFVMNTTMGIYGNKVAFFSSTKDNFSFIVTSEEFAETMKDMFNFLWQMGSKE